MDIHSDTGEQRWHDSGPLISEIEAELAVSGLKIEPQVLSAALNKAIEACQRSYRPYVSDTPLRGAAVIEQGGARVFGGTDIQNAAYPSSLLAVAQALRSAATEGARSFDALVIYGDDPVIFGAELDIIHEFTGKIPVIQIRPEGSFEITMHEAPFDPSASLEKSSFPAQHDRVEQSAGLSTEEFLESFTRADLAAFSDWAKLPLDREKFFEAARAAIEAAAQSYSPYSHYPVGAALVLNSGKIVSGCNIESLSMLGMCAERNAIGKGVAAGLLRDTPGTFEDQLSLVIVYVPAPHPANPCGGCRQALLEFSNRAPVVAISGSAIIHYAQGLARGEVFEIDAASRETIEQSVPRLNGGLVPSEFSRKNLF